MFLASAATAAPLREVRDLGARPARTPTFFEVISRLRSFQAAHRRAFTLIELLVVIVILGILMAVALPTFLRQQNKAKDSEAKQYLATGYKDAKAETVGNAGNYPAAASLVSAISQAEPQFTVTSGACSVSTGPKNLVVSAASGNNLTLCNKSNSGHLWQLAVSTAAPAPTFTDLGAALAGYSATILVDSPASYWRLADTSGTTATAAAGAISGTYTGGYTLAQTGATSDGDKAVLLNGTNGTVNLGNNYSFTGNAPFSLEIWINAANITGNNKNIFNKQSSVGPPQGEYALQQNTDSLSFYRNGDGNTAVNVSTPSGTVVAGTWEYVVATYDGATMRLYVNGVLKASQASATAMAANPNNLFIGTGTFGSAFSGSVDEAAIYNTALTCGTTTVGQTCTAGSQINSHYAAR